MSEPVLQGYRAVIPLLTRLLKPSLDRRRLEANAAQGLMIPGARPAIDAVDNLSDDQVSGLRDYIMSPDLDYVAHQVYAARTLEQRGKDSQELLAACREQIRLGLKSRFDLSDEALFELVELVFSNVLHATQVAWDQAGGLVLNSTVDFAIAGRITAAAVRNTSLLEKVERLSHFHAFETELRSQIASLHAEMRLPHAGISRAVPYRQLYVQPHLHPIDDDDHLKKERSAPSPKRSVDLADALTPGRRLVILGAPGAGKSTLVSKLAHDLATDSNHHFPHLTPLLLILRDIVDGLTRGGNSIVDYITDRCRDPYNVDPPEEAIEYLLLNGRAVAVFDGLDELVDTSLRTKAVRLIEGFISRYPLTPIVITSRRVGYDAAPLNDKIAEVAILADFDDEQVDQYASNWFRLDNSVPVRERIALKDSFIRDSGMVRDLRVNPLMLSLLCSMYSTERYIPRNRPDVFEKCATMLFERWDRMRGIDGAMPFGAHIRSAVQHLAWELFTKQKFGGAMPRRELIEKLAEEFFGKRHQDLDLARDEAERFLDFCTGRAWVLTDVGATETEPRYGFVHRTFLEFFTAEHLVRTRDSSPGRVLQALGRRLEREEWEIVAQLALQILDRNVSGGADKFLAALAARAARAPESHAASLLSFVIRSEPFATLSVATARKLLKTMIDHELRIDDSLRYWDAFQPWPGRFPKEADGFSGTFEFIDRTSPENGPVVARALATELSEQLPNLPSEHVPGIAYLYYAGQMSSNDDVRVAMREIELSAEPRIRHHAESSPGLSYYQVLAAEGPAIVQQLELSLTKLGGQILFQNPRASADQSAYTSIAELLLTNTDSRLISVDDVLPAVDQFLAKIDTRPWYTDPTHRRRSLSSVEARIHPKAEGLAPLQRGLKLAMYAPYIEIGLARGVPFEEIPDWRRLALARTESRPEVIEEVLAENAASTFGVASFLKAWAAGEVSTVFLHHDETARIVPDQT
ncbi:NACHT domain-containing protein [Micromonospora sp. CPCC 205711]|uniref:NACHT domain-containing protein n=1 Tax=Micromonospora sp. CPCC 205547 TaxID=3122400 RepID=UPI002FF1BFEB